MTNKQLASIVASAIAQALATPRKARKARKARGRTKARFAQTKAQAPKPESEFVGWLRSTAEHRKARQSSNKALAAELRELLPPGTDIRLVWARAKQVGAQQAVAELQ